MGRRTVTHVTTFRRFIAPRDGGAGSQGAADDDGDSLRPLISQAAREAMNQLFMDMPDMSDELSRAGSGSASARVAATGVSHDSSSSSRRRSRPEAASPSSSSSSSSPSSSAGSGAGPGSSSGTDEGRRKRARPS